MEQWKRVTFFLLLNVIVSACTTLGVLVLWDQFRPTLPSGAIQPITLKLSKPTATITSTTLALQAILTPTPAYLYHTVQDGDTFESIAQQYNVSVDELTLENGYTKSQLLSAGELLRVPIHLVVFSNLIGAGDLETEHLIIKSEVSGALDLTGWRWCRQIIHNRQQCT